MRLLARDDDGQYIELDYPTTLDGRYGPRRLMASGSPGPFVAGQKFTTSGTTIVVGYDATDGLLILAGQGTVVTSTDNGTTLSSDKGVPFSGAQTNPGNQIGRIVRFKNLWVCLIKDQTNSCAVIFTSPAPGAGGTCTWTLRASFTTGSDGRFYPCLDTDGTQVIAGEYGDPLTTGTKNPHIWRSTDGLSWSSVWSASGGNNRHVHAVAHDPYTTDWYATFGDGVSPCLLRSTDGGQTWVTVAAIDSTRQAVQISFDATYIYLATDAGGTYGTQGPFFVLDRATLASVRVGAWGDHRNLPVPVPGKYATGSWTSSSTAITDFTATPFAAHMIGAKVTGSGIPDGATIASVSNSTTAALSVNAASTQSNQPYQIHGVSEQWYSDPFFGVVDPATGVYYFATSGDSTGLTNTRRGLFYVPYLGGPVCFLDYMNTSPRAIFTANGYLFCGNLRRPLLTPA